MSLGFVLGRAGSGKTFYCIDKIVSDLKDCDSDQELILLVPEQATYQMEKMLLEQSDIHGYNRLKVLSFERLVFWLLDKNIARKRISTIGRQIAVEDLLQQQKDTLQMFSGSVGKEGLAKLVIDCISSIYKSGYDTEDISKLIDILKANSVSAQSIARFEDIKHVFTLYREQFLKDFIDSEEQLNLTKNKIKDSDFLKGAKIWIDGFSGFTGQEKLVLAEIFKVAKEVKLTLCLDPDSEGLSLSNPNINELDVMSLFAPVERTYVEIYEIAKTCKILLDDPVIFNYPHRFAEQGDLRHLENTFLRFADFQQINTNNNIEIVKTNDPRSESDFVAKRIKKLVMENGYRYNQIGLMLSDIAGYEHYLKSSFADAGVPIFIDKPRNVSKHPLLEMLSSAFEVIETNYETSAVLSFLKSKMGPLKRSDVELLENYCLEFGIKSNDWVLDVSWNFASSDRSIQEKKIDKIRRVAIHELQALSKDLKVHEEIGVSEFVCAIFRFIEKSFVVDTLAKWIENAIEKGDIEYANEQKQFYVELIELLDEFSLVLKGRREKMSVFVSMLISSVKGMTLSLIPPVIDSVVAGTVERSRSPELKVMFLLGATSKQFPSAVSDDGLLGDKEKQLAEDYGFSLGEQTFSKLAARQYIVYIAMTRAAEKLIISWPQHSSNEKLLQRSNFVDAVLDLFNDLEQIDYKGLSFIENTNSKTELLDVLCYTLGHDCDNQKLRKTALKLGGIVEEFKPIIKKSIEYNNKAILSSDVVKEIFNANLKCSTSRVGMFAACPFKHFASYILRLRKRDTFKIEPADLGTFYHKVLELLFLELSSKGLSLRTIEDSTLENELSVSFEEAINADSFMQSFVRHSKHNVFVVKSGWDILKRFVFALREMNCAGEFNQIGAEVDFGNGPSKGLGDCQVKISGDAVIGLRGVIDRLDIANINGQNISVVYDYKRKGKKPEWKKIYNGLDLQLITYLLAVNNASILGYDGMIPGGAFFLKIDPKCELKNLNEIDDTKNSFVYKCEGFFSEDIAYNLDIDVNSSSASKYYPFKVNKDGSPDAHYNSTGILRRDDFKKLLDFAEAKLIDLGQKVLGGSVEVYPFRIANESPCEFCEYASLCRFDWLINQYNFMESVDKKGFFEKLQGISNGSN